MVAIAAWSAAEHILERRERARYARPAAPARGVPEMSGKKFDEGKLRMDLIPPAAIYGLAKVLTYGSEKYGQNLPVSIYSLFETLKVELKACGIKLVDATHLHIVKDCADLAMKENCVKTILNMLPVKGKILKSGAKKTMCKLRQQLEEESLTQPCGVEIKELSSWGFLPQEGSQKPAVNYYLNSKRINAPCAEDLSVNVKDILIMTMIQDSQEVICVASATTDLASSMTLLKILAKQFNISLSHLQVTLSQIRDQAYFQTGDRNWEKGIDPGRVFAAAQRHLWAYWSGEDTDEESGLSHLDHAACNIAFLQTYRENGRRVDS